MCILFMYVNNNPSPDGYQLVIANNRDEFYDRPAQPAAFWEKHPYCIGGADLKEGREGGTWLGASTRGKVGCLLNIRTPSGPDASKKGRGHLVSDYLTSSVDQKTYLEDLAQEGSQYNEFNLIFLEKISNDWHIGYYSNCDSSSPCELQPGVHGFSNSVSDKPWTKVGYGKEKFSQILAQYPAVSQEDSLQEELINLLNDTTQHWPDPQLAIQGGKQPGKLLSRVSAIYVDCGFVRYGTRTNTVLMIDAAGRGRFVERTMQEPIDANNPVWNVATHTFALLRLIAVWRQLEDATCVYATRGMD
ncbi:hypothetical protein NP493_265g03050 [Ridgeia piscesae]|uniref:Uncharacterized protein n=1 Tax=Ridgeia piscesae TaxID=27915 RepID=A0AAD9NXX1_RIDPI|nr:hypothetical protein NP493_265g03050 [Ridgeia piscesae]